MNGISEYKEMIRGKDNEIKLSDNEFLKDTSGFSGTVTAITKLFSNIQKDEFELKFDEHKVSWSSDMDCGYVTDHYLDRIWGNQSIILPSDFFKYLKMLKDAKAKNILFIAYPKKKSWMLNEGTKNMFQGMLIDKIITRWWIKEQQFIYGGDIEASELIKLFKDGKKSCTKSYYFELDEYGLHAYFDEYREYARTNENKKGCKYRLNLKGEVNLPAHFHEAVHVLEKDAFKAVLNLSKDVSLRFAERLGVCLSKKEFDKDGKVMMYDEMLLGTEGVI